MDGLLILHLTVSVCDEWSPVPFTLTELKWGRAESGGENGWGVAVDALQ